MSTDLAQEVQQTAEHTYGVVPNLFKATGSYTGMPGAVYIAADQALMGGLLKPVEQQAVLLDMARYHGSRYDAVVHARMGLDAGLSPSAIDRLLDGELPESDPLRALVEVTRLSCKNRGWLERDDLKRFEQRGVSRGKLYEIFALIGMKTFTGFIHHIADTPIDDALQDTEAQMDTVPEKPETIERQRLFLG